MLCDYEMVLDDWLLDVDAGAGLMHRPTNQRPWYAPNLIIFIQPVMEVYVHFDIMIPQSSFFIRYRYNLLSRLAGTARI